MADTKTSDLTALTGAAAAVNDLVMAVDVSDTSMAPSGTNKRMQVAELALALTGLDLVGGPNDAAAVATDLGVHIADPTAAHAASAISFTPDGSISATTVQAAIVEVRDEAGGGAPSGAAGGDLSGTYPNLTVESAPVGFTVGTPTVGAGFGINSTTGIATEQATLGLLFYGTQWAGAATIDLRRINGSKASPSAVQSGDVIGGMHIGAAIEANNSTLDDVAQFYSVATENYSSTATGNRWDFYVAKNSAGVNASTSKQVAFRIDQDGALYGGFGTYGAVTSPAWSVSNTGRVTAPNLINLNGTFGTATALSFGWNYYGASAFAPVLHMRHSRGTAGSETKIVSGDALGAVAWGGWNDTAGTYLVGVQISAQAAADFTGSGVSTTSLVFQTAGASGAAATRMILASDGTLHIGASIAAAAAKIDQSGMAWFLNTAPATQTASYNIVDIADNVAITHNAASLTAAGIDVAPVISYSTAPASTFGWRGFQDGSTHQNTSGSTAVMAGVYVSFEAAPTLKTTSANAQTVGAYSAFRAQPVLAGTASGVLTITTMSVFNSTTITVPANVTIGTMNQMQILGPTVSASGTITTRRGINITDASNSGTLTDNIGIDIAALSAGGTTNLGIRTYANVRIEAANIVTDTGTGMQIATGTTQKIGFYGATPIVKPSAFTQTYSTASHTHAAVTASNPPAGGTGATAGAYDTAANRNLMITSLTNTIADVANVKQVLNGLIDDLQSLGLIA